MNAAEIVFFRSVSVKMEEKHGWIVKPTQYSDHKSPKNSSHSEYYRQHLNQNTFVLFSFSSFCLQVRLKDPKIVEKKDFFLDVESWIKSCLILNLYMWQTSGSLNNHEEGAEVTQPAGDWVEK